MQSIIGKARSNSGIVKSNFAGVTFKLTNNDATTKKNPKLNDPVSPRKMLAGKELYLKNNDF